MILASIANAFASSGALNCTRISSPAVNAMF
jgi:hypothetical protein